MPKATTQTTLRRKSRRERTDLPYEAQLVAGYLHGAEAIGRYIAIPEKKVYRWVSAGRLPSVRKVGRELHASTKGLDWDMQEFPVVKVQLTELWNKLDRQEREEILEEYG